jgi:hypothetical protein
MGIMNRFFLILALILTLFIFTSHVTYALNTNRTKIQIINLTISKSVQIPICICPRPTEWSPYSIDNWKRTNYRCSETTGYSCQSYVEYQIREQIEQPKQYGPAIVAILLLSVLAYVKFRYAKPKTSTSKHKRKKRKV